ncbi:hypothetical protein [Phytohabitans rumicis]|uniref:Uncharacterized protein n=1 Tax=Phytohabitans rumicis TaxID=1076125 RepID=A0A6V8KWZ8_9ACTN|nr:hypothetical protein [Phytohabitans rumicis]GFJ88374.1 hypothetical protein Prum_020160 [Phytohabitans rumicis]
MIKLDARRATLTALVTATIAEMVLCAGAVFFLATDRPRYAVAAVLMGAFSAVVDGLAYHRLRRGTEAGA